MEDFAQLENLKFTSGQDRVRTFIGYCRRFFSKNDHSVFRPCWSACLPAKIGNWNLDCNICTVDCKNGGCSWNTMFGITKFCPKIVGFYLWSRLMYELVCKWRKLLFTMNKLVQPKSDSLISFAYLWTNGSQNGYSLGYV